jgi:hypothetical protein
MTREPQVNRTSPQFRALGNPLFFNNFGRHEKT